jgi:hypothetical protein
MLRFAVGRILPGQQGDFLAQGGDAERPVGQQQRSGRVLSGGGVVEQQPGRQP